MKSFFLCFVLLCTFACGTPSNNVTQPGNNGDPSNPFIIVDRTGKEWDVSHAFQKYQMVPGRFQFGLGPDAIRPILNPRHIHPGESGYPADHQNFLIIGAFLEGEARGYAIDKLFFHEVADEEFGDVHVAVAY